MAVTRNLLLGEGDDTELRAQFTQQTKTFYKVLKYLLNLQNNLNISKILQQKLLVKF